MVISERKCGRAREKVRYDEENEGEASNDDDDGPRPAQDS